MSSYGLLRGISRATTSAADDIGERLKQERLAAQQANRDTMLAKTRRQEATTAFEREKELLGVKTDLGIGGAENDRRFARNLKILHEEGAIDENGNLRQESDLNARARMAAVDAKLLAPAVGSADITVARNKPLAGDIAETQESIEKGKATGKGRGQTVAKLEENLVPAYQSTVYAVNQLGQAADTAKELMEHPGFNAAFGFGGETLSEIPETAAAEAKALLDQLRNRTFISALQQMRESSPTGGAVGQVTEAEGKRMENAYVALTQAQGPEQARRELGNFIRIMEDGQSRSLEAFELQYKDTAGFDNVFSRLPKVGEQTVRRSLKPMPANILDEAKAAIKQGKPREAIIKRLEENGYNAEGL